MRAFAIAGLAAAILFIALASDGSRRHTYSSCADISRAYGAYN